MRYTNQLLLCLLSQELFCKLALTCTPDPIRPGGISGGGGYLQDLRAQIFYVLRIEKNW